MKSEPSRVRNRFMTGFFTAGMETGGYLSLVSLLFLIPGTGSAPLLPLCAGLLASALLSGILSSFRIRRIWIFLINVLGFLVFLFFVSTAYLRLPLAEQTAGANFFGTLTGTIRAWITAAGSLEGSSQWAASLFLVSLTFLFWFRGYRIGSLAPCYSLTVRRFDAVFGILLAVSLIRGGFRLSDPDFPRFILLSILAGAGALISAKNLNGDLTMKKSRSPLGMGILFISLLLPAAAAFYAFYPLFTRAAEKTYALLRAGAETAYPWLERLLLFLLRGLGRTPSIEPLGCGTQGDYQSVSVSGGSVFLEKMMSFVFFLFVGLGAVLIVVLILYRIVLYLLKTSGTSSTRFSFREFLRAFVSAFRRLLNRISSIFQFRGKPESRSGKTFRRLLRWGLYSGLPRGRAETPLEYGRRLAARFPMLNRELLIIVETLQEEYYGGVIPVKSRRRALTAALRRLGNPAYLPARLKSLFFPRFSK